MRSAAAVPPPLGFAIFEYILKFDFELIFFCENTNMATTSVGGGDSKALVSEEIIKHREDPRYALAQQGEVKKKKKKRKKIDTPEDQQQSRREKHSSSRNINILTLKFFLHLV